MIVRVTLSNIMDRWLFEATMRPELPDQFPELIARRWTEHRGFMIASEALYVIQEECSRVSEATATQG